MAEIVFEVALPPRGQARARNRVIVPRGGKPFSHTYKASEQRLEEEKLSALIAPHRPPAPFSGPVELAVILYCPIPRSWSRKKQAAALAGQICHVSKPDLDNAVKHLMDVLTGMVYADDKQIVVLWAQKKYGEPPRWEVTVREVAA